MQENFNAMTAEPMFTAHIVMDKEIYVHFNHYVLYKNRANAITIYILSALFIVLGVVDLAWLRLPVWPGIAYIILGVAFPFLMKFICWITARSILRSDKEFIGTSADYRFFEDNFEVMSSSAASVSQERIAYDSLYDFAGDEQLLMLFKNRAAAYLLTEDSISDGKGQELRAFLRKKIPLKRKKAER